MTTYTVKAASKKKDVAAKEGKAPKQVIALTLAEDGKDPVIAEWFTNASTPLPAAESTIDGDLTNDPQWGWKFAKAASSGGWNGGGGGKSGAERESIERQVAAKCASDLLVGFMNTGWKPDTALKLGELHTVLAKRIAEEIKTP